jgi:hypothetical protein
VGTATVAKKTEKPEMKLSVVKIETTLAHRAKTIADDRGIPVSTYLSELIRAGVARDIARITSRRLKEGGDE